MALNVSRAGRLLVGAASLAFALAFSAAVVAQDPAPAGDPGITYLDQGSDWTAAARADFYTRDQGSQMIPLAWLRALRLPNGQPFLGDGLVRYGYLPNPSAGTGLPVGFTIAGPAGNEIAGMTCAACHTRQITAGGKTYRVDGGPAIVDFQALLRDLDAAVLAVLASDAAFAPFAAAVLGPSPTPGQVAELRAQVALWSEREHTLYSRALPPAGWGLGRLDAVGMIFNRLTGLDLGKAPTYLIPENIRVADAPTRYPFLWNAAKQDKTQWPGFADNGNDILGLSRNLGEVYGVFGTFHPKKDRWRLSGIDFKHGNSANFDGLNDLETLIRKIGAPAWPWAVNQALAAQGGTIYARTTAQGGCADCHGEKPGERRLLTATWATPVLDVGTDSREYDVLAWTAKTGVLSGKRIPVITEPLKPVDKSFNVLKLSVLGGIIQHYVPLFLMADDRQPRRGASASAATSPLKGGLAPLAGAFRNERALTPPQLNQFPYESRVMKGVWAAAPYLHNGSVPTLADLLKPAAERPVSFAVGQAYDRENIGLAAMQTGLSETRVTTGCEARNSGNSRCGHEYGTTLTAAEKRALLEYLKTL